MGEETRWSRRLQSSLPLYERADDGRRAHSLNSKTSGKRGLAKKSTALRMARERGAAEVWKSKEHEQHSDCNAHLEGKAGLHHGRHDWDRAAIANLLGLEGAVIFTCGGHSSELNDALDSIRSTARRPPGVADVSKPKISSASSSRQSKALADSISSSTTQRWRAEAWRRRKTRGGAT